MPNMSTVEVRDKDGNLIFAQQCESFTRDRVTYTEFDPPIQVNLDETMSILVEIQCN